MEMTGKQRLDTLLAVNYPKRAWDERRKWYDNFDTKRLQYPDEGFRMDPACTPVYQSTCKYFQGTDASKALQRTSRPQLSRDEAENHAAYLIWCALKAKWEEKKSPPPDEAVLSNAYQTGYHRYCNLLPPENLDLPHGWEVREFDIPPDQNGATTLPPTKRVLYLNHLTRQAYRDHPAEIARKAMERARALKRVKQ